MGVCVSAVSSPALIIDQEDQEYGIEINEYFIACGNESCENHLVEKDLKDGGYCPKCGNELNKYEKSYDLLAKDAIAAFFKKNKYPSLQRIRRSDDRDILVLVDEEIQKNKGCPLKYEYMLISETSLSEREEMINEFKEKHEKLLVYLKNNKVPFEIQFINYVYAGY